MIVQYARYCWSENESMERKYDFTFEIDWDIKDLTNELKLENSWICRRV